MTALSFFPSNAPVAAFPQAPRRQISIRAQEGRERWATRKAEIEASRPVGFQPCIEFIPPSRAGVILGEKPVHRLTGRSGDRIDPWQIGWSRAQQSAGRVERGPTLGRRGQAR